ncbi:AbrB/MazE/SpoVT family DNA-binding domain-containing protein [Patescibacteria group bacterium]|nr:AbrB/MazE/SpoVT family DNA-binding domain-containing protein [Patescibacteria group bacterium]
MTTIAKTTTKGQITLPAKWRRNFSTSQFIIEEKKDILEIRPLELNKLEAKKDYTVFDALRDNKGQGLRAKDLVKILKRIDE